MTIARKRFMQQSVSLFVTQLRKVKPLVTGEELKALGYRPWPLFFAPFSITSSSVSSMGIISDHQQALDFVRTDLPCGRGPGDNNALRPHPFFLAIPAIELMVVAQNATQTRGIFFFLKGTFP